MTLLEMRGISKWFGAVHALDQVDLTVEAGEIRALVGENGSGKTTLMRILAGSIQPSLLRWVVVTIGVIVSVIYLVR